MNKVAKLVRMADLVALLLGLATVAVPLHARAADDRATSVSPHGGANRHQATDPRTPLPLTAMMAEHQKASMRDHLAAVQEIVAALAADDMSAIQKAVARIGYSDSMAQMCEHMGAGAPGFTDLALTFHRTADTIADAAGRGDRQAATVALAATLGTCVSCHAAYRQDVVDETTGQQLGDGSADAAWLEGSIDERFAQVAKHLRGFDVAMVETGYRYVELYWAGMDGNWGYAEYQLGKIRTAIANGVERRPRRAQSARMLDAPLQQMEEVILARDQTAFAPAFATLTATCNACHQAEQVPFVTVRLPAQRLSPVHNPAAAGE